MNPSLVLLALIAALGACSAETSETVNAPPSAETTIAPAAPANPPAPAAAPSSTPALVVEGDGLRLFDRASGSARPLAFGTAQTVVMAALAFRGPPRTGHLEDCSAGPLDTASWADGLALYFQEGKLAGWAIDAPKPAGRLVLGTAAGIGPGSTRSELEAEHKVEVMESSLGTEFNSGNIAGVLDGRSAGAKIDVMWAGANCVMR